MFGSSSMIRSHESKKNAAIAAIATSLAKKNNDQLYLQLKRHRDAWKKAKDEILNKYQSEAMNKWAQSQNKK